MPPRAEAALPPIGGGGSLNFDSAVLKPHPLLSIIPGATLEQLLSGRAVGEYPKGTVVFRAGDPSDAIFLIISGRCESLVGTNGNTHVEEVFGPGDTLGQRAFLNREPHRTTVIVATHCVLLRIPGDELQGLFSKDPSLAGRFSQSVTEIAQAVRGRLAGKTTLVRRVVSILPLATRVDGGHVVSSLAAALYRITGQSVLLVHLGLAPEKASVAEWRLRQGGLGPNFCFSRQLQHAEAGFDELGVTVSADLCEAASMAPFISHCGRHYDFVLLHIHPDTPAPCEIESLIESDLAFVLLQASTQNLYDFQLLTRALYDRAHDPCAHVRPILFAEESIAAPEVHAALKRLGHPVHSVARGFPLNVSRSWPDRRFELHINRLAREIARCRVGLALSSGGAKGLAHVGVIQALEENGIEIDCVTGSSMGAYVAACWAYGFDGTMLEKMARENEGRWGLFHLADPVVPPRRGFMRTRRIAARLRKAIGDAHFSDLLRPLRVVATHLDTLERVVFSSGDVVNAVEASIAIPGICVPVTMDGETYIDGGIADPLPVDVLMEMGIERIIAVNVIPPPERIRYWLDCEREQNGRERERSLMSRMFSSHFNYLAHGNILDTMMQAISGAQTRVAEASAHEADIVLRPLACDALWHDFTHPQKYIALGRNVAEAQMAELKVLAGGPIHEPRKSLALAPAVAA